MRAITSICLAGLVFPAGAQPAPRPMQTMVTSAGLRRLIVEAAASIKPGEPVAIRSLLDFAPYKANLEYRIAATHPAIHQAAAEFFYVLEGGGTLVEGGVMTDPKPIDAHNLSGMAITGGTRLHVSAGDVLVIPPGTPHWFNAVDGRLVMIVMKVPQPVAAF